MQEKIIVRTGEKAPKSGVYRYAGRSTELVLSKGERVPPNSKGHRNWVTLVRTTKT